MTPARLRQLRSLLWLYFWLLIFEGALRKWILPGLSNPLLLVRDPVALLALCWGWPLLRKVQWLQPLLFIGVIAFLLAITIGHGDIPTAAYGSRILVLQLPLIFLFPAVFDRSDVISFAWALAWLSIPMTILIVAQSNLPSSHILNVAPGGVGSAVFSGALDRFRPPGVFSFTSALSTFYGLAASALFIILYETKLKQYGMQFSMLVAIALVVALPVSLSRSLLAGYLQVVLAVIAALALSRARLFPVLAGLLGLLLAINISTTIPAFQQSSEAFTARWDQASAVESGSNDSVGGGADVFQERIIGSIIGPLYELDNYEFFGRGIGIGTSVGAQRLTGNTSSYIVGEGVWEVTLNELGFALGLAFTIWRIAFAFWLLRLSILQALLGNRLPLFLLGSTLLGAISGQFSQPTGLGFIVLSAGLTLAACNGSNDQETVKT